jgi:hypothetical protein
MIEESFMASAEEFSPIATVGPQRVTTASATGTDPRKIHFLAVGMSNDQLRAHVRDRDRHGICNSEKTGDVEILAFANECAQRTTLQQLHRDGIRTAEVDVADLHFLVHVNEIECQFRSRDEFIDLRHQVIETFKSIEAATLNETMKRLRYAGSATAVCALLTRRDQLTANDIDKAIETEVELDLMPWSVPENFGWIEIAALHCDGHAILHHDEWEFASLEELWLNDCDAVSIQHLTDEQRASLEIWQKQIGAAHARFLEAVAS